MPIKLIFSMAFIAAGLLLSFDDAAADDYRTIENSSPQEVVDAMSTKVVRGVANAATGWVEFPKQIYITFRDDGIAKGLFVGPLKGVGMTLVRTVTGVLETVTFFVPYPGFYDPYFDPSFVWQKE